LEGAQSKNETDEKGTESIVQCKARKGTKQVQGNEQEMRGAKKIKDASRRK